MRVFNEKFADLGHPKRIWAVAAIYGDIKRLVALHDHLATRFAVGDRLVYMGNYTSPQSDTNRAVMDELLAFRSALLSKAGMDPSDIVYLRGPAEEAWQRLLRLQFAPVPGQAMEKLHEAGVGGYLRLYNVSLNDTKVIARAGSIAITRWTNQLRDLQRKSAGYETLLSCTRRAATTQISDKQVRRVLFVPAGFDGRYSLEDQGEALWGTNNLFNAPESNLISRIVRGFDPERMGIQTDGVAITLDGGSGRGGPLACGLVDISGQLTEIVTVGGQGAVERMLGSESPVIAPNRVRPTVSTGLLDQVSTDTLPLWGTQAALSA